MYHDSRTCELNYFQWLPFANLYDIEFKAVTGTWYYDFKTDIDIFNVLPNTDKFDERDSDLIDCESRSPRGPRFRALYTITVGKRGTARSLLILCWALQPPIITRCLKPNFWTSQVRIALLYKKFTQKSHSVEWFFIYSLNSRPDVGETSAGLVIRKRLPPLQKHVNWV